MNVSTMLNFDNMVLCALLALVRIIKNRIMNIAELKKLINDLPDDFEFEVEVSKKLTKKELEGSKYPYPYKFERCSTDNRDYDIGHGDKKIKIGVRINEL